MRSRELVHSKRGWSLLEYVAAAMVIVLVLVGFRGLMQQRMMDVAQEMDRQFRPVPGKAQPTADAFLNNWGR